MKVNEALQTAARSLDDDRLEEAEKLYRGVLAVSAGNVRALAGLAELGLRLGRAGDALPLIESALQARPDDLEGRALMARALFAMGRSREGEKIFAELSAAHTDHAVMLRHWGIALHDAHAFDKALPLLSRAVALRPDSFVDQLRLGKVLVALSRPAKAAEALSRAVALQPEHVEAHLLLAQAFLLAGDFPRGYEQMEWRWRTPQRKVPMIPYARWQGQIEPGKKLLLLAEEGFGDTIQFAGFVAPLVEAGLHVTLMVREELVELLSTLEGVKVIPPGGGFEQPDYYLPMLSLPLVLGSTPENLRHAKAYLSADPRRVASWRDRLPAQREPGGKRVGIGWTGGRTNFQIVPRSIPLPMLRPLASVPGVQLHSLHNAAEARREAANASFPVIDHADHLKSFADTAALMANLDLIITIDTSVAHLAGALGLPVWIMLVHPPDGRWLLGRSDTPWYPSARLFRQQRVDDWNGVSEEVHQALLEA